MSHDRREFLLGTAAAGFGASAASRLRAPAAPSTQPPVQPPARPFADYVPVETPNGVALAWKDVNGVKVFHLVVQPVRHEFAPGLQANCWGYNGRVHGPTIEAVEGDRVRIYVSNELP